MKDDNIRELTPTPHTDDVFEGAEPTGEENSIDFETKANSRPQYTQSGVSTAPPVCYSNPAANNAQGSGYQGQQGSNMGSGGQTQGDNFDARVNMPPQNNGQYYGQPQWSQQGYRPPYGVGPKKKMSTPLVVFLSIFSVLVVGSVMGMAFFGLYSLKTNESNSQEVAKANPYEEEPKLPFGDFVDPKNPDSPNGEEKLPEFVWPEDSAPGEAEGEASAPSIVQPDIDVPSNAGGMKISPIPSGAQLTPKQVYNKVLVSTVTIKANIPVANGQSGASVGTGIIISSDGFIITNSHVIGNTKASGITVITSDGKEYPAVAVGFDKATDLAVLKTDDHNFTPAEIGDSGDLGIGDSVMAIGNPGGSSFSGSLTGGIVSGLERSVGYSNEKTMTYIQTDAAINPGNSGGPLVNMYGQVVGINTSKIVQDYYEGMGFAIPSLAAKTIVNELLNEGYVSGRVRLGISGSTIDVQMALMYGCPQGVVIAGINEDSSFANSGAQTGDVITHVDGEAVDSLEALTAKFLNYKPGDKAQVTLYRLNENGGQGSEFKVKITLLEDKGETQK